MGKGGFLRRLGRKDEDGSDDKYPLSLSFAPVVAFDLFSFVGGRERRAPDDAPLSTR